MTVSGILFCPLVRICNCNRCRLN